MDKPVKREGRMESENERCHPGQDSLNVKYVIFLTYSRLLMQRQLLVNQRV